MPASLIQPGKVAQSFQMAHPAGNEEETRPSDATKLMPAMLLLDSLPLDLVPKMLSPSFRAPAITKAHRKLSQAERRHTGARAEKPQVSLFRMSPWPSFAFIFFFSFLKQQEIGTGSQRVNIARLMAPQSPSYKLRMGTRNPFMNSKDPPIPATSMPNST